MNGAHENTESSDEETRKRELSKKISEATKAGHDKANRRRLEALDKAPISQRKKILETGKRSKR